MSSLIVEVCKIDDVQTHPNADKMEIAIVKGWRTCIGKGQMKKGDLCVYIPPDAILPIALSDRWKVTNYLSQVKDGDGNVIGGRVKVARLRGEPSYGFVMAVEDPSWVVGHDVVEHYGITKWEPPQDCTDGDAETPHPAFHHYYNIENLFNFPDVIKDGEEVVFTEKIHGMNARVGLIRDTKDDGTPIWRFMAGSHDVRRKELQAQRKRGVEYSPDGMPVMEDVMKPVRNEKGKIVFLADGVTPEERLVTQEKEWFYEVTMRSRFFEILDVPGIRNLLVRLCNGQNNVIVFGELYGSGIQDLTYGMQNGQTAFRVFDISVNGKYMSVDKKIAACTQAKLQMVPTLYRGPYSKAKVDEYVGGPTTLCDASKIVGFKDREGIVITTVAEHSVATEKKFFDRACLKAISFAYEDRKGGTEFH